MEAPPKGHCELVAVDFNSNGYTYIACGFHLLLIDLCAHCNLLYKIRKSLHTTQLSLDCICTCCSGSRKENASEAMRNEIYLDGFTRWKAGWLMKPGGNVVAVSVLGGLRSSAATGLR